MSTATKRTHPQVTCLPCGFRGRANIPAGVCSRETSYATLKFPLTTESDMRKTNKHQIKRAGEKIYDSDVAKVNSLLRLNGEKKLG